MVGCLVGVVAARLGPPGEAWRAVALVTAFTLAPIAVLMALQVRRGAWQNVDASNARERPALFMVGGLAMAALLGFLAWRNPQSFLLRGTAGVLAMLAVCAVATRWVKVSLHLAFAALAATLLLALGSAAGWAVAAAVPVLVWSRLALGRHSWPEIVLGGAIGVVTGLLIQWV
jgi:hypothetical protein